jgi:DEP domain-containing protein 5
MSRNAGAASFPRKGWSSHLRQFSKTSLDRSSLDSPKSPDTVSSHSTLKGDAQSLKRGRPDRRCTVTVNEGYSSDEVLLNLDLFPEFHAGILMTATVLKLEADKTSNTHGVHKVDGAAAKDGEGRAKRYIFVVKDLTKDLKARHPGLEIYVVKHIADAFGMKKGVQVLLNPVGTRFCWGVAIDANAINRSIQAVLRSKHPMLSSPSRINISPGRTCGAWQ